MHSKNTAQLNDLVGIEPDSLYLKLGETARSFYLKSKEGRGLFGNTSQLIMLYFDLFDGSLSLSTEMQQIGADISNKIEELNSAYVIPKIINESKDFFSLRCVCQEAKTHIDLLYQEHIKFENEQNLDKKKETAKYIVELTKFLGKLGKVYETFLAFNDANINELKTILQSDDLNGFIKRLNLLYENIHEAQWQTQSISTISQLDEIYSALYNYSLIYRSRIGKQHNGAHNSS